MTHLRRFVAGPPSTSPTILLDVDDHQLVKTIEGTAVSPPSRRYEATPRTTTHGEDLHSAFFNDRDVILKLAFEREDATDQVAFLHELAEIVSREALLMWQDEGMPEPRFYITKPADIAVIDHLLSTDKPLRHLTVQLPAEPFALSAPVAITPFTIRNDPAAAVANPMMHVFEDIIGDAPAPLYWEYANDPDAAHRILWALESRYGSAPELLVADDFNRPDSTTSVGSPLVGPAGQNYGSTIAGIIGHKLYFPTDDPTATATYVWDTGQADGVVESTIDNFSPGVDNTAIMVRSPSDENGIYVSQTATFTVIAGVFASIATHSAQFTDGDRMRVRMAGNVITVSRQADAEGEWVQVSQATTSQFNTITKHGFSTFGANGDQSRFKDIRITSLSPASVPSSPYWKSLSAEAIATSAASYYDQFTRVDSALTLGVASPGGGTWNAQAGTWGISTNRAYNVAGVASDWATAVIPFGQADVIVEVTMETQESAGNAGLVIRSADANTGIAFLHDQAYDIATAAQSATVGPEYSETFETGDVMRVVARGARIDVYRQAGGVGSFSHVMTVTTTLYQANTRHGLAVWGSSATDARFDNFRLGTQLTFGWTLSDAANSGYVSGTRRTLSAATGHVQTIVPTAATMLEWPGLPVGRYRVMVRIEDANDGVELLFWNRPPKQGTILMRDEAAASALVLNSTTFVDWYDLGIVDMPGGAPEADDVFGLDSGVTATALWNFGIYNLQNNTMFLDAIVLIPAGRPGTETQHGSATFPDTYTAKSIYLDGENNRRYAVGAPIAAPTKRTRLMPTAISGGLPELAPGASNALHFFATAADPASKVRISDSKTLDTMITGKYFPRWLYDRPAP